MWHRWAVYLLQPCTCMWVYHWNCDLWQIIAMPDLRATLPFELCGDGLCTWTNAHCRCCCCFFIQIKQIRLSITATLLAMQTAVLAMGCLSICLSVRPSNCPSHSVFCPDEWRYNRAVISVKWDDHSSFWGGKAICRGSLPAKALKWSTPYR